MALVQSPNALFWARYGHMQRLRLCLRLRRRRRRRLRLRLRLRRRRRRRRQNPLQSAVKGGGPAATSSDNGTTRALHRVAARSAQAGGEAAG